LYKARTKTLTAWGRVDHVMLLHSMAYETFGHFKINLRFLEIKKYFYNFLNSWNSKSNVNTKILTRFFTTLTAKRYRILSR